MLSQDVASPLDYAWIPVGPGRDRRRRGLRLSRRRRGGDTVCVYTMEATKCRRQAESWSGFLWHRSPTLTRHRRAELNQILTLCMVSVRRGNIFHTFHSVEFEPDLYLGVMQALC